MTAFPRIAFTAAAIAQCEQGGHRFTWVRTRGPIGRPECRTCGETRAHCSQAEFVERGAVDVIPTRPVDPAPRRGRGAPARTKRNAQVVAAHAAGDTATAIAARFGVSVARICQILKAARTPATEQHQEGTEC